MLILGNYSAVLVPAALVGRVSDSVTRLG